jgi:hypothetical protein
MPNFVLLHHEFPAGHARASHVDLMLEVEGMLRTWALAELPVDGREIVAQELADHRLAYLDYEGEVSNDRGRVTRSDRGSYQASFDSDAISGELDGEHFRGAFEIVRQTEKAWLFAFRDRPGLPRRGDH